MMLDHRYKSRHEHCSSLRSRGILLERQIEDVKVELGRLREEKKKTKDPIGKRTIQEEIQKVMGTLNGLKISKYDVDSRVREIESEL